MHNKLVIRGAREHNLKNIDLDLEKDKLIVISGSAVLENPRWPSIRSCRGSTSLC